MIIIEIDNLINYINNRAVKVFGVNSKSGLSFFLKSTREKDFW